MNIITIKGGLQPDASGDFASYSAMSLLSASPTKVSRIFSDERGDLRKRLELSGSSLAACQK